jgi:4-amino-4-deoxy-L-arabinose transferase-like glycosyltransferase
LSNLRRFGIAAVIFVAAALYLSNLSAMGMIGPDEPRYAWVSRAMAQSGDWLIPRLWNQPWYEKPPLLYWLSGLGFAIGLGDDLAPRVPVALLSLAFLTFFWWRVRALWDVTTAWWATTLLGTTAGWLAYSHIAVTDVPMAVFFSMAVLLCCGERPKPMLAAAALGLAVLAKGLVPLVLFAPVLAVDRARLKILLRPAPLMFFAVIAVPWFVVAEARSAGEMFQVLFVQQTFSRLTSTALQHVQPWWFYLPVSLLLLFPWFPLLPLAFRAGGRDARTLSAVSLFGLVFFSAAINKLPGYLLPLMPATSVLLALGLKQTAHPVRWLAASLVLLGMIPMLSQVVPIALAKGLRATPVPWPMALAGIVSGGIAAVAVARFAPRHAFALVAAVAAFAFLWFESTTFPRLDEEASARAVWRTFHPACIAEVPRAFVYGMYYYSRQHLAPCQKLDPDPQAVVR